MHITVLYSWVSEVVNSNIYRDILIEVNKMFTVCVGLVCLVLNNFKERLAQVHYGLMIANIFCIVCSLQYKINIITVEVN